MLGLRRQPERTAPAAAGGGGRDRIRGVLLLRRAPPGRPRDRARRTVAGALDEAVGLLASWYAFPAVTARIFVRYRHPVAINTELMINAWLEAARGRRLHVNASITDGAEVLAECKAALLHVPLEQVLRPPEGAAAAQRWAGQLDA